MKLQIRKEYFDKIESGEKKFEYRDAHITFVCESTGRTIKKYVVGVNLILESFAPKEFHGKGLFDDEKIIEFKLL